MAILLPNAGLAQQEADFVIEGVTYYATAGTVHSGHMADSMDFTGGSQYDFFGCVHAVLRPEKNHGVVRVYAEVDGAPFQVYMNQFEGELPAMSGGLAEELYVDGSRSHDGIQHPAVFAAVAGWGYGDIQVGRNVFADPVTGEEEFKTSFFVTPNAFRDNATGAVLTKDGLIYQPGKEGRIADFEWEMHMRVESAGGTKQPPARQAVSVPAGATYMLPAEDYSALYYVPNLRFGGELVVDVTSTTLAQPGENHLDFIIRAPNGTQIAALDLDPALNADDQASVTLPLSAFGMYTIEVMGKVSLSKYTLSATQTTPDTFDMSLWWDNVTFGGASTVSKEECEALVGAPEGEMVARIVSRPTPPPFEWVPILFGTLGGILTILISIKISAMVIAALQKAQLGDG